MLTRRKLLAGLIAAPAIVRPGILMPLRGIVMPVEPSLIDWGGKLTAADILAALYETQFSAVTREAVAMTVQLIDGKIVHKWITAEEMYARPIPAP